MTISKTRNFPYTTPKTLLKYQSLEYLNHYSPHTIHEPFVVD